MDLLDHDESVVTLYERASDNGSSVSRSIVHDATDKVREVLIYDGLDGVFDKRARIVRCHYQSNRCLFHGRPVSHFSAIRTYFKISFRPNAYGILRLVKGESAPSFDDEFMAPADRLE
jgi:hypothetical protein